MADQRPGSPHSSPRIGELDALRGIAALAVVLFHYLDRYDELHSHVTEPLFYIPWGARGVQLFFVISGFVIFMTLQRTQRPMDFVVSRFSRLYPGYWVAIIVTTLTVRGLDVAFYERPMLDVVMNFTMLQKLSVIPADDIEGAYWTLYVELWFYVAVLALFTLGLLRHIEAFLLVGLGAAMVWWAGEELGGGGFWGWNLTTTFELVFNQIPFFVIGIGLYRIYMQERPRMAMLVILAALACITVLHPLEFLGAALVSIAAFALVLTGRAGFLRQPVLIWLGAISYSLYLVHNFAGRALILRLQDDAGWTANASVGAALAASLLIATVLTWWVERPAQRLIRRGYAAWRGRGGRVQPDRARSGAKAGAKAG
ncbi:acyltransferase family protein [Falsiroseomonas sp. HC035]|uniref:acyltransferase family protein n=1 Tax=Falsiroseomonas sp. HC035 TaxID=3390999 RepID=UPI003D3128BA